MRFTSIKHTLVLWD